MDKPSHKPVAHEANRWPSVLHGHRCGTCGMDRTCLTINCVFRPMDRDGQGVAWVCCFCKEPEDIW